MIRRLPASWLFLLFFALTLMTVAAASNLWTTAGSEEEPIRQLSVADSVTEVVVVVISATFCVANHVEGFPEAVAEVMRLVRDEVKQGPDGYEYASIGVSLDWDPREGADYLSRIGDFSEIAVGRNWGNSGAIHFIWRDHPGPPTVPQIVLAERRREVLPEGIHFSRDRILSRFVGAEEILEAAGDPALIAQLLRN